MILAALVAHDPNLVIGNKGGLPWHYPEDLKYFKRITMGYPMIMGRKVFESLNEKPLPGRENVVLSRNINYEHVPTFTSFDAAVEYLHKEEIIFVIGGGEIYQQFMHRMDKLFVTEIHQEYEGDTYFPEYRGEIGSTWKEIKRENKPDLSFVVYERMNK
jgi:dihydrofolate reductase